VIRSWEKIVDCFAGGGGASLGIELALGRSPDVAINHDPEALAMHAANHPRTLHLCGDVWEVKPLDVCQGQAHTVGLLWASPDCKHFSKAKGGALKRSKEIRSLAWVVVNWAREVHPRVIILENVEEFQTWGPLDGEGRPDPTKKGETFAEWLAALRAEGYVVEWRELRACDYGAPTTRKRLFLIARCDAKPIEWPAQTHGRMDRPYRTAAECIDFSIPCPSIFARKKPLAEKTLRRIARGIKRFVLDAADPFVIHLTHSDDRINSIREPLRTITCANRGELALVAPTLVQTGYGERPGQAPRSFDLHAPLGTVVAGGAKHALVCAFLAKHYGGNETPGSSLAKPFDTVTCKDHHALVEVRIGPHRYEEVCAFLASHGLTNRVRVGGDEYVISDIGMHVISDIGMRMLTPRELFRAQGFDDSYQIAPLFNGKPLTKTAQVRMCGNSVSPVMSRALVAANFRAPIVKVAA
jgi:DNA (cytosine-5)-methyltransferase 1